MAGVDFRGTSAKKCLAKTVALGGGGEATDCAGVGFGAIRAGGFLPVKDATGGKTVSVCAKTLDHKGDLYHFT